MTAADAYALCLLLAPACAAQIARLQQQVDDLTHERDAARRTVEQQQTEHANWRLEYGPRHPRGDQ
ncbi:MULTISPECIES: hypothetical protein [Streptomyces]|uniref:Secreted protein n=2 Tax=Streptomyces rimosus subsp. rimosus TaxID=132474 RepID=A0A8A1ULS2_STRR1|nr:MULTISPECIES: hypothetical protein [Streptomyces]MYT47352.1 hypothetical protein [Streptomyces sp. SID5471]KEF19906.1 hypothetical protein DF18_13765 [Streptomyces rimosus]QDA06241.1 hypothetical protein CTZ40_23260 [Streptomyces rimosus]QEV77517.1 hypothetical protein CP984_23225 [Streptomyces rimosus]QGY64802.1 hypothetical protein V519_001820 [Streptomyces rimosus R6-500]